MGLGKTVKIERVSSGGKRQAKDDTIPRESFISLYLNREKICVLSCSPQHPAELAAGHIVSQGYLDDYDSIDIIEICDGGQEGKDEKEVSMDIIPVKIRTGSEPARKQAAGYIPPGCGSIDEGAASVLPAPMIPDINIRPEVILGLNRKNLAVQEHKKALGGLHSAALFDLQGELLLVREDIGRHNCLDKIIGNMLINGMEFTRKIIFTSGRISVDLVLKAVRVRIPAVVTNSSVTHSAAALARDLGLIILGYARGNRFNIYSYPERIK